MIYVITCDATDDTLSYSNKYTLIDQTYRAEEWFNVGLNEKRKKLTISADIEILKLEEKEINPLVINDLSQIAYLLSDNGASRNYVVLF